MTKMMTAYATQKIRVHKTTQTIATLMEFVTLRINVPVMTIP
jgi:hypothetical protein